MEILSNSACCVLILVIKSFAVLSGSPNKAAISCKVSNLFENYLHLKWNLSGIKLFSSNAVFST